MNIHSVSPENLMAYLDGELPVDQAAKVAVHVELCRECQELAADFEIVSRRLVEWQVEEPKLAARDIFDANAPEPAGRWTFLSQDRWAWAILGVVVLLAIAVVLPVTRHAHAPNAQQMDHSEGSRPRFAAKTFSVDGQPLADSARELGERAAPPAPAPPATPAKGPLIVRTAELNLTTREFEKSRGEIEHILGSYHGYVAHLSITTPPEHGRSLDATLKVPAAQLDNLVSALRKLGRVDAESQGSQEVTQQAVDLEARLSNARTTEQRLTELLRDRTGKLSDVLAVEEQIDSVRERIEQMQAEQESLSHQIAFASLDLKLAEEYEEPLARQDASTATRLRNAAVDGYEHVISGLIDLLTFLLAYGPGLLIAAAILYFPARALWRRRRRATA